MRHFHTVPLFLLGASMVVSGCDSGTAPTLGGLNPDEVVAAVDRLVVPIEASSDAASNLEAAFEDLEERGVQFRAAPTAGPLPVEFPVELRGKTFAHSVDSGAWEVDESRDGAPSEGLRVVWYELDGTDELVVPLVERGHADLTTGSDPDLSTLAVAVIEGGSGGESTRLDFVQGYRHTESPSSSYFEAAGFFSDDSERTDFSVTSEESEEADSGDTTYGFSARLEDGTARYDFRSEGSQSGDTGAFEDHVEASVELGGSTTVIELTFEGEGSTQEASGTVMHDGDLIADVSIAGSLFSFTAPGGGEFPGQETAQLNSLFSALMFRGLVPIFELPVVGESP